jgi:hypothetical protein
MHQVVRPDGLQSLFYWSCITDMQMNKAFNASRSAMFFGSSLCGNGKVHGLTPLFTACFHLGCINQHGLCCHGLGQADSIGVISYFAPYPLWRYGTARKQFQSLRRTGKRKLRTQGHRLFHQLFQEPSGGGNAGPTIEGAKRSAADFAAALQYLLGEDVLGMT